MSRHYDNWERLVAAVLKREQYRQICRSESLDSSFTSFSSDTSFTSRTTTSFSENKYSESNPRPAPPRNPYLPPGGGLAGAVLAGAVEFAATPEKVLAWSPAKLFARSKKRRSHNALVTGVPKLNREELVILCENFTNVLLGSSSTCTLFKGTLSTGVEIVVASIGLVSPRDWSNNLEVEFRNKIVTLSRVIHKNFINLLGYCSDELPFTRMMVFEYAPNGTLFEHLHIKEAEHLNWEMRLRIAMDIASCLENMHHLKPVTNLTSSTVYLTEDYASKLSDFFYWDEVDKAKTEPNLQSNVYSFGIILFEMITGYIPYSDNWSSDYPPGGEQSVREMIDRLWKHIEKINSSRLVV